MIVDRVLLDQGQLEDRDLRNLLMQTGHTSAMTRNLHQNTVMPTLLNLIITPIKILLMTLYLNENQEITMERWNRTSGKIIQTYMGLEDRRGREKNQIDLNSLIVTQVIEDEVTIDEIKKRGKMRVQFQIWLVNTFKIYYSVVSPSN